MKKITLTIYVNDTYLGYDDRRRIKNQLAQAAVTVATENRNEIESIEVKVGNIRRKR